MSFEGELRIPNCTKRNLRCTSPQIEPKPAPITTHAVAEPDCQSGRLLIWSVRPTKANRDLVRGRLGLSVPLRWRPAHGGSTSNAANNLVPREQIMYALSQQRYIWRWLSTKARQCRSSSWSRLTLPSRGRPTGYALRPPLMSNVKWLRALTACLRPPLKSGTPGRAGGLFQLAPQRGKKLESPEGDITCPA
jgi:hypothetical protein